MILKIELHYNRWSARFWFRYSKKVFRIWSQSNNLGYRPKMIEKAVKDLKNSNISSKIVDVSNFEEVQKALMKL